jgi:hypothetical protein
MLEDKRIDLAGAGSSKHVFRLICQWDENSQNLIVVTLWLLWSSRNGTNAGESTRTSRVIAGQIIEHCMDFKLLRQPSSNLGTTQSRWSRPPPDFLKINVDGSFVQTARIGGWGFIVRDDVGSVVRNGAGKIEHCTEAMQAEAMVVLHFIFCF